MWHLQPINHIKFKWLPFNEVKDFSESVILMRNSENKLSIFRSKLPAGLAVRLIDLRRKKKIISSQYVVEMLTGPTQLWEPENQVSRR